MQKVIFGIFTHPDDEAFGPVATLIQEVRRGALLHLICATAGEAGVNVDNHPDLGAVRLDEWRQAAERIGASSTHYLGYRDSHLCNDDFHTIADTIEPLIRSTAAEYPTATIEFMSFDTNGISGHLDRVLMARVTCYLFYKLRDELTMRLRLFCVSCDQLPAPGHDWIYSDLGRDDTEITEVVDARNTYATLREVMRTHHSQRSDYGAFHAPLGEARAINSFITVE